MSKQEDNELKFLQEHSPIIKPQTTDFDIYVLGENPVFNEKKKIKIKEKPDNSLAEIMDEDIYYEEIGKNTRTARKFKNKIFLGTDDNYYISKKNKKGNYVWMLLEKK